MDMAFDPNNFCWLSFANGIQKFDGRNFTSIPVQPGLPDDKGIKFFRSSSGVLFLSHSKGISTYDHTTDKLRVIYSSRGSQKLPAMFLGEDNGSVFFYMLNGIIGEIDLDNFRARHHTMTGFVPQNSGQTKFPTISHPIRNHRLVFQMDSLLYLWDLQKRRLVFPPANIRGNSPYALYATTDDAVAYFKLGNKNELLEYDFSERVERQLYLKEPDNIRTFRAVIYKWGNRYIQSYYNRLFELSPGLAGLSTEMVNYQNHPIAGTASIAQMREDNFGNLYLVTINDGFRKIIRNNFPIKYYGNGKKDGNYSLALCVDKPKNRIITGTFGNGVLIFDTLQRLVKHFDKIPGKDHSFSVTQIVKSQNDGYYLFSGEMAWHLDEELIGLTQVSIKNTQGRKVSGVGYFSKLVHENSDSAIFISQSYLYNIDFKKRTVTETDLDRPNVLSSIKFQNNYILFENDELQFINVKTLLTGKRIDLPNTGGVRCYATDNKRILYVGTNKGVFMLDSNGRVIRIIDKKRGLPDECIYSMVLDRQGFLWCSTNKGVFKLNSSNRVLQLNKEDGLQENEFNTNISFVSRDGEIFFGGVNGVSSFYPSDVSDFHEEIFLLLTELRINNETYKTDTAVWAMDRIVLPYDKSSLSFDFIAMANNNPEQYSYQYMMEGVDKEWVQSNQLSTVRYFLLPGKYKFKIYAARYFDGRAKPMKEITIIIRPPYWKTWWFLGILGMLIIVAMAIGFNQYNRSKYEKRLSQFEAEQKLRLERERISRDLHDSIGAYANAVLYNTELLEKEKNEPERHQLMADLKFASKDIITSLRETIWALKKDQYTAEECLMRIRNFIQPFNRYYSRIKFRLEGDAPPGMELHYTRALNLVRIVQEAVTNGIKHGNATAITITSRFDPHQWEVTVKDDGSGFTIDETESEGNGLNNMRQRARESEFEIKVASESGKGTTVHVILLRYP
jgi:signal transduction histidine kinase